LLVKRFFFLLNAAFAMTILDLSQNIYLQKLSQNNPERNVVDITLGYSPSIPRVTARGLRINTVEI
jgi:hypothetical protein